MSELTYALFFAREIGLLSKEQWQELDSIRERAGRLTWRLYETMARRP